MNDKIRKLREQIKSEESKIKNCNHDFGDTCFDPEEYSDYYFTGEFEKDMGVDARPIYASQTKTKDRWSRKCKKCGFKQYTYKQKPIIKSYEADFN